MTDYSKLNRAEKLYVLSQVCIQNTLTPTDPAYTGLIIRVCTSKLAMSKEAAQTYADDLKSAYEADKWEGLAASHQPEDEAAPVTSTPQTFEPYTPTLKATLLNFKSAAPVNHIGQQLVFECGEYAPKTIAGRLMKMAQNSDFNGVGRIMLSEARYDLDDKTLRCDDITQLIKQFYPKVDCEQRPGNTILVYFHGKNVIRYNRDLHRVIPQKQPALPNVAPLEKADFPSDKTNNGVGEVIEDDEGVVEDETE